MAESFDVELDPTWIDHAHGELEEKLAAKDHMADMAYEQWRDGGGTRTRDESQEVDEVFKRLADDWSLRELTSTDMWLGVLEGHKQTVQKRAHK